MHHLQVVVTADEDPSTLGATLRAEKEARSLDEAVERALSSRGHDIAHASWPGAG